MNYLRKMFQIYEKACGYESEKTAKVCNEIAQIYENKNDIIQAIDNYKIAFDIWEKIIKDGNHEVLFTLAVKIAELLEKIEKQTEAYDFLKGVI